MKRMLSMVLAVLLAACVPALAEDGFPFVNEVEAMVDMHNILMDGLPEEIGDVSGLMLVPVDVTEMPSRSTACWN